MIKTQIEKCHCCDSRILYIHGECIKSESVPHELIPVADFSLHDLQHLAKQIKNQIKSKGFAK
jgi:hypothetical protein